MMVGEQRQLPGCQSRVRKTRKRNLFYHRAGRQLETSAGRLADEDFFTIVRDRFAHDFLLIFLSTHLPNFL